MKSYHAILEGDRLVWQGERPQPEGRHSVTVTLRDSIDSRTPRDPGILHVPSENEIKIARRAMQELRAGGGVASIPDPVAWQREIRRDRPLPGRE